MERTDLDETWTLGAVLPDCPDEQLLDELAVVVSAGWDLPARRSRAHALRHLLVFASDNTVMSFEQSALRLLTLINDALLRAGARGLLSADDEDGLRILFGVHPNYKMERSPTVRREAASFYLLPAWSLNPPSDRTGTFQRRHQGGALAQALECLRIAYGQHSPRDSRPYDLVSTERFYLVDENRQVVLMRNTERIKSRIDGLDEYVFHDPKLEYIESTTYRITQGAVQVADVSDDSTNPALTRVAFQIDPPAAAGDLLEFVWEQRTTFVPDVTRWAYYFVGTQASSDNYQLTMTVRFTGEIPQRVWWYSEYQSDLHLIEHDERKLLVISDDKSVSYEFKHTERRADYGLQWEWEV